MGRVRSQLQAKVVTHAEEWLRVLVFRATWSNWFLVCRMCAVPMTMSDFKRGLIMSWLAGNERIAFRTLFSGL